MKFLSDKKGFFNPTFLPFIFTLIISLAFALYILFPNALPFIIAGTSVVLIATGIIYFKILSGSNDNEKTTKM